MSVKQQPLVSSKVMKVWRLSGGRFSPAEVSVIIEKEFTIFVNNEKLAAASLTPGFEKEFAIGYLYGQGFINSPEDITDLQISANAAKATLKKSLKTPSTANASYRIVSGGGRSVYSKAAGLRNINSDLRVSKQDIFKAINTMFEEAGLYKKTEGVHAVGLFNAAARLLCIVEDIGRHNTLDKIIGYALLNKIDCSQTFLVSTGRMASEMVTKICRTGIPVAATKTAVTDRGLRIAKECGLTLIGFVRDTGTKIHTDMDVRVTKEAGMKIYTGAQRIRCDSSQY
jgi:FdhD protein